MGTEGYFHFFDLADPYRHLVCLGRCRCDSSTIRKHNTLNGQLRASQAQAGLDYFGSISLFKSGDRSIEVVCQRILVQGAVAFAGQSHNVG